MVSDILTCPSCLAKLRRAPDLLAGSLVMCPRCQSQFPIPSEDQDTSLPPQPPLARLESDFSDRPVPPAPSQPRREALADAESYRSRDEDHDDSFVHDDDYEHRRQPLTNEFVIDMGEWFNQGGKYYNELLGPMTGFLILGSVLILILYHVTCPGVVISLLVLPAWQAGPTIVALAAFKGRRWTFGDLFSGFHWWSSLSGLYLLQLMFVAVTMGVPILLALIALEERRRPNHDLVVMVLGGGFVGLAVLTFLLIRLTFFAVPLIVERDLGVGDAMAANWNMTRDHFWSLFGISLLLGLIFLAGYLACGVGLLFTAPWVVLTHTAGYLLCTGRLRPRPPYEPPQDD
jgi:hypothetical protein